MKKIIHIEPQYGNFGGASMSTGNGNGGNRIGQYHNKRFDEKPQLVFLPLVPQFSISPISRSNQQTFPQVMGPVYFDINEQKTAIGRDTWNRWRINYIQGKHSQQLKLLPDYDSLISIAIRRSHIKPTSRGVLYFFKLGLGAICFNWPNGVPILDAYIGDLIDPSAKTLGPEIQNFGDIIEQGKYRYFFPV